MTIDRTYAVPEQVARKLTPAEASLAKAIRKEEMRQKLLFYAVSPQDENQWSYEIRLHLLVG